MNCSYCNHCRDVDIFEMYLFRIMMNICQVNVVVVKVFYQIHLAIIVIEV